MKIYAVYMAYYLEEEEIEYLKYFVSREKAEEYKKKWDASGIEEIEVVD